MIFRTVDAVAAFLGDSPSTDRRIVGIAGAPGAGKSTIAEQLAAQLGAALLTMDGYHLPQHRLRELGLRDRMGAPDTFDLDAFIATLAELHVPGGTVVAPGFDRELEEPVPGQIAIAPDSRTVVVEGNYLLHDSGGWNRVAALLDVNFFVEVEEHIRLARLIDRHVRYGKTPEEARAWALGPDEANAVLVAGTASRADHVIRLD